MAVKGVYILLVELPKDSEINTLRRKFNLPKGFYLYVGSAMNNLETRIARHLSPNKKRHWHIDYLLDVSRIMAVFRAQTGSRMECELAGRLDDLKSIRGFGCSDCRCRSHLFYGTDTDSLRRYAEDAFNAIGLEPNVKLI
ncbi:Uri superfamily endonuclease [Dehalogenimonas formicexedens]|uniref:Uri superfamily endonuclease n=1 Tax=Dehalogenimonas formicexedens TaxID=1839801 RepID=A0A1P8F8D1_9CHLR|nr:GIY-YIG nuclease family protein [Dehalogenimonas formicexedens]APV44736.1 Uri superfamily endonuclease [Dehalogenimonas formicexedens]